MISSLELARLCGVSQGTVDRALHGRGRIAPATRERILLAAQKHGYSPNPAVQEMLTGASTIVGALVPGANSAFYMDLLEAVRSALEKIGLRLLVAPCSDEPQMQTALEDFCARRVRAVVVISFDTPIEIPAALAMQTPIFCLVNPCRGSAIVELIPDECATGEAGVEFLFARGHRRITFVTYPVKSRPVVDRRAGYYNALSKLDVPCSVIDSIDTGQLKREIDSFGTTAFFCHNDRLAFGVLRHLTALGLSVGTEVSVMGIDNAPTVISLVPDLTTLQYPVESVVGQIIDHLNGKEPRPIDAFRVIERLTVADLRQSP